VIDGAWTVTGPSASNVAIYPSSETVGSPATHLNVQQGAQALDLTGDADNGSASGVRQTLATNAGTKYSLSFYVGSYNSQAAQVQVYLDGALFQSATGQVTSGYTTTWTGFQYNFTASGSATTLSFVENVPSGVTLAGLDNVSVAAQSAAAAPEPASLALLVLGIPLLFLASRRLLRSH
jgi:hypothetical protein